MAELKKVCSISLFVILFSCSNEHPAATELCDCYTLVHREWDSEKGNQIMDSCEQLLQTNINDLKGTPELDVFFGALNNCR